MTAATIKAPKVTRLVISNNGFLLNMDGRGALVAVMPFLVGSSSLAGTEASVAEPFMTIHRRKEQASKESKQKPTNN